MRISESRYSNPERLPERAETDSFNKRRDHYSPEKGTSTASKASPRSSIRLMILLFLSDVADPVEANRMMNVVK